MVFLPEIAVRIAEFEKQLKIITDREKALKAAILREMEQLGVIKLETPELLINYIAATDREALDTKALKAELPEVFDTYCKISSVKPQIRIKVK